MSLIFVRHGQSEANAAGIIAEGGKPALTESGIAQAQKTGDKIILNLIVGNISNQSLTV